MSKAIFSKYRKHLEALGAENELLEYFDRLFDLTSDPIKEIDIQSIFIDACVKFNFTRPFEVDSHARVLRHSLISGNDGSSDAIEELGYRRGYDQGFDAAIELLARQRKSIKDVEEYQKVIHRWRVRPFQILGSSPGSEENESKWFSKI